ELTLSPPQAIQVGSFAGNIASLERDGNQLVGITDTSDLAVIVPGGTMTTRPLRDPAQQPIPVSGGDLTHMPDGDWLWWANQQAQLYRIDLATGSATPIGPKQPSVPFVTGLVHDNTGRLYATSDVADQLIELDPTTGG